MEEKEIAMPPLPEEPVAEQPVAEEPETQGSQPVNEGGGNETEKQPVSQPAEQRSETTQQKNFRTLREEKERLEQEKQQALRKLAQYEKDRQAPEQTEEDLEINIGDDDLFEGKHYRKLQKQLKKQQDTLNKYQEQVRLSTTETKLKTQYVDFDKVVSEENIKRLREQEPEIAETIASTSDIYTKAVSAYKMIKKMGIYVEDNYGNQKEIVKQNSLKPKPLASVSPQQGDSPLTKANAFADGLTPELKKQLWREMEEASQRH